MEKSEELRNKIEEIEDYFVGVDPIYFAYYLLSMLLAKAIEDSAKQVQKELYAKYEDPIRAERAMQRQRFRVYQESAFSSLYPFLYQEILLVKIKEMLQQLEESNIELLNGIFSNMDFSNYVLGQQTKKIERLSKMIEILASTELNMEEKENLQAIQETVLFVIAKNVYDINNDGRKLYTPIIISQLISRIIEPRENQRICDPVCGSGTLLSMVANQLKAKHVSIYGNDSEPIVCSIARLNLIFQGYDDSNITNQDFLEAEIQPQFDIVVGNPPYSVSNWMDSIGKKKEKQNSYPLSEKTLTELFPYGVPPASKGDYAFVQRMLSSVTEDGQMIVLLPHGALFRGGAEKEIRAKMIKENIMEAVIGLPSHLFNGTSTPICLVIFKKKRQRNGILFIDASKDYKELNYQKVLTEEGQQKIVQTYQNWKEQEGYSYIATREEIVQKEYNLDIPKYVIPKEQKQARDRIKILNEIEQLTDKLSQIELVIKQDIEKLG